MRVVPAFDEIENGEFGFGMGAESIPVDELAFERGKETFTHRVIETIADGPH